MQFSQVCILAGVGTKEADGHGGAGAIESYP
jgi:hypothetical protein